MKLIPSGIFKSKFAPINVTLAPRDCAASAIAIPCFPEDLFPMYLTGSMFSRVPPAVINTLFPDKSELISKNFEISTTSLGISGYRPTPTSFPVIRPSSGSTTKKPRSRSFLTFSIVAGLLHISGCIAGTKIFGASELITIFVSRSSHTP